MLKNLQPNEWVCGNCKVNPIETSETHNLNDDIRHLNANVNVTDVDFDRYNKMLFNPLRYENMTKDSDRINDSMCKSIDIKF